MKPSILVTGGLDGVGQEICDYFAPHSKGVSRRNGFDIGHSEDRARIMKLSFDYDIFVNHANNGRFSGQTMLLYEIFDAWEKAQKTGYIINTGTYSTYSLSGDFRAFSVVKFALDTANRQCCKKIENGHCHFRMTNIRPGMLDTPKSRQRPQWNDYGISGVTIAKLIEYLYFTPKEIVIPEFVVSSVQRSSEVQKYAGAAERTAL